ncbi:ABC transporter substrate-binding protein [Clostridium coskatii]|uniref:NMT1/THI5 like protein n=1 Tax=Clostridium coskatii TaxID=1705578 RepID=A0A162NEU6_9CLOT|nr:ABC transporter substrate-binding protein [Clostridium coskatii]OAA92639.1 hypothetical protein WX73_00731 [Clostridium coskatii]OBR94565.1 hypothetical protein CLCOS_18040 [Clostridium coskatii]
MTRKKFCIGCILLSFIFIVTIFTGCGSKKDSKALVTVKLNEVARSVFYAPMYVAINKGMFKEQGINIDLTTGQGAEAAISKTQEDAIREITSS